MRRAAQHVEVFRVPAASPGDLSGVKALVATGALDPRHIVAVMGKTEGNGCVNDFTRDLASVAWHHFLGGHLGCSPAEVASQVSLVMSGGTEGVLSPHFTIFARSDSRAEVGTGKRLVAGIAHTRPFRPEDLGRQPQIEATAEATRAAMADAGIADPDDVHFVQVKCPLLTSASMQDARERGWSTVTQDTYESMGYSRGASALGVGIGLGELEAVACTDSAVLADMSLYSSRASASAGIELDANVVIVLGEAVGSSSPYRIAHTVMQDAIDGASVSRMLREDFGLDPERDSAEIQRRLVNLLGKAEASPDGRVRGSRHTMLNDSDINSTRHARAAVGAVLASIVGQTALYVSGGSEHQGPPGGGPVAAIVKV